MTNPLRVGKNNLFSQGTWISENFTKEFPTFAHLESKEIFNLLYEYHSYLIHKLPNWGIWGIISSRYSFKFIDLQRTHFGVQTTLLLNNFLYSWHKLKISFDTISANIWDFFVKFWKLRTPWKKSSLFQLPRDLSAKF